MSTVQEVTAFEADAARATVYIHDRVLADPVGYRARALVRRFQTVEDGVVRFQGIADCADPTLPIWLKEHYPTLMPVVSFFRRSPEWQDEPHYIHDDRSMGDYTAIYYMNPDPAEGDGTNFYRNRESGAFAATSTGEAIGQEAVSWFDLDQWDLWLHVPAQFNRLVLFPAAYWHSRAIPENYGEGDAARLIQVCFSTGVL